MEQQLQQALADDLSRLESLREAELKLVMRFHSFFNIYFTVK
jgi:hypothetical protein